ncbi:hypothetical protein OGAPHI_002302 [Ogataea philodendri]|uniref:Vacuolar protein sorting-associated protein IST1 n=1 Tax=Ogataea philodendri TaxID=1378263 RepID=A0A9P8PAE9_9ASCO|nr:uncharacterized protein OGAPHI_002302 [Ogataea philodendri]KAH3668548.1 hypothetical protein OGAPHI_002302 [Ogataea philodendri]
MMRYDYNCFLTDLLLTLKLALKTTLKMTSSKLQFKAEKMKSINKATLFQLSKELKELNQKSGSQFDRCLTLARVKISKVIVDDNLVDLYEILVVDCEVLHSKIHQLQLSPGDENITKIVRKLMYVNSYVNIKEFKKLVTILAHKYGKDFYEDAINNPDDMNLVKKCQNDNVDQLVESYLKEICDCYKIDLYGETQKNNTTATEDASPIRAQRSEPASELDDLKQRFDALKKK